MLEHAAVRCQPRADHRSDQGPCRARHEPGQPGEQIRRTAMSDTSRRGFLGALAVSGATLAASQAAAAPGKLDLAGLKKDTEIACLYHCDFGDPKRFEQMLTNMNNHLSVYEFDDMKVK